LAWVIVDSSGLQWTPDPHAIQFGKDGRDELGHQQGRQYLPKLKHFPVLECLGCQEYICFFSASSHYFLCLCLWLISISSFSQAQPFFCTIRTFAVTALYGAVRFVSCGDDVSGSAGERLGHLVRSQMQTANSWTWPVPALAGEDITTTFSSNVMPSGSILSRDNQVEPSFLSLHCIFRSSMLLTQRCLFPWRYFPSEEQIDVANRHFTK